MLFHNLGEVAGADSLVWEFNGGIACHLGCHTPRTMRRHPPAESVPLRERACFEGVRRGRGERRKPTRAMNITNDICRCGRFPGARGGQTTTLHGKCDSSGISATGRTGGKGERTFGNLNPEAGGFNRQRRECGAVNVSFAPIYASGGGVGGASERVETSNKETGQPPGFAKRS